MNSLPFNMVQLLADHDHTSFKSSSPVSVRAVEMQMVLQPADKIFYIRFHWNNKDGDCYAVVYQSYQNAHMIDFTCLDPMTIESSSTNVLSVAPSQGSARPVLKTFMLTIGCSGLLFVLFFVTRKRQTGYAPLRKKCRFLD